MLKSARRAGYGLHMAMARRDTRPIVIDGLRYRWRVIGPARCCYDCAEGRTSFVVQRADAPGPLLKLSAPVFPVRPAHVAAAVREAVRTRRRTAADRSEV
jgi:hypothetical protein